MGFEISMWAITFWGNNSVSSTDGTTDVHFFTSFTLISTILTDFIISVSILTDWAFTFRSIFSGFNTFSTVISSEFTF